jgi:chromosome segregation ATPase
MNEISGMLYTYVLDYKKSLVLNDIQNAERAAAFTSRQHQRLLQNLENLTLRLLDAENEKRRLEESVKTMELEIEVLKQRIENNKADQEKTYEELEQIRKVLEMHKERLKKLN